MGFARRRLATATQSATGVRTVTRADVSHHAAQNNIAAMAIAKMILATAATLHAPDVLSA